MTLSNKGIRIFEKTHPDTLPWNLYNAGPASQRYFGDDCSVAKQSALIKAHARFGGWIAKAAELPLLAKTIKQSVTPNGCLSPRTFVNLWSMAEKYPSPHALERKIVAVQHRAMQILRAYDGRGCTLRSAMIALSLTKSVGKAAIIATFRSLTGEQVSRYSVARNILIDLHHCKVEDEIDGVVVHRTMEPVLEEMNTQVYQYVEKGKCGWKPGFIVRSGTRSYHATPRRLNREKNIPVHHRWVVYYTERGALGTALQTWAKQKN